VISNNPTNRTDVNPGLYSDKATDENLTSENWELILGLCDKVQDEGQPGYVGYYHRAAKSQRNTRAHAAIAAILKRLAHRNPNVQLYALSLAESLSKNLGIEIHRELASRAFTQGLEKLITDRVRNIVSDLVIDADYGPGNIRIPMKKFASGRWG
jgi:hypothetical protein